MAGKLMFFTDLPNSIAVSEVYPFALAFERKFHNRFRDLKERTKVIGGKSPPLRGVSPLLR